MNEAARWQAEKNIMDSVEIIRITITPETAFDMLTKTPDFQRNIKKSVVDNYARDMKEGRWNDKAADPIRILEDGTVIDGQHRLNAIVESGTSHVCVVYTYNVEEDEAKGIFRTIDCGSRRDASDFINAPYAKLCSGLAKKVRCVEGGASIIQGFRNQGRRSNNHSKMGNKPTRTEQVETFNENREEIIECARIANLHYTKRPMPTSSVIAYFVWVASVCGKHDEARAFVEDLTSFPSSMPISLNCKETFLRRDFTKEEELDCLFAFFMSYLHGRDKVMYRNKGLFYAKSWDKQLRAMVLSGNQYFMEAES